MSCLPVLQAPQQRRHEFTVRGRIRFAKRAHPRGKLQSLHEDQGLECGERNTPHSPVTPSCERHDALHVEFIGRFGVVLAYSAEVAPGDCRLRRIAAAGAPNQDSIDGLQWPLV